MTAKTSRPSGAWKPSVFNIFHFQNGRFHSFNSISTAAFSLPPDEYRILRRCLADIAMNGRSSFPFVDDFLAQSSFIVPRDLDEYGKEHQRFLRMKSGTEWGFLSVVPTFGCNLGCTYCFQRNARSPLPMTGDVCGRLVELFSGLARRVKGIAVFWFGGEPLLALKTIEQLSAKFKSICHVHGVQYHAEMITNGSLLNKNSVRRLKELSLRRLEISIDGLPESYSRRKGLPLERALATYDFLFQNVDLLIRSVRSLVFHINVDRDNIDEAREFVLRFKRQHGIVPEVNFRLQVLSAGKGLVECIPYNCFSNSDAVRAQVDFRRFLFNEGLLTSMLPVRLEHPCMAVRHYAYTIAPDGLIGKCVPATGISGSAFFRMDPHEPAGMFDKLMASSQPYADFDPFVNGQCGQCPYLPVCLGLCPKAHETGNFLCARKPEFEAALALCEGPFPSVGAR